MRINKVKTTIILSAFFVFCLAFSPVWAAGKREVAFIGASVMDKNRIAQALPIYNEPR